MINPFKIASLAYNVLLSQNENAAELLYEICKAVSQDEDLKQVLGK